MGVLENVLDVQGGVGVNCQMGIVQYASAEGVAESVTGKVPSIIKPTDITLLCKQVSILLELEEAVAALACGLDEVAVGTELLDDVVG